MASKQIVILGGSGFIGGAIKEALQVQPHGFDIVGISSSDVDLTNYKEVTQLKEYFKPNTVVLMCSGLKKNVGDTLDEFSNNMRMCTNLCAILKDYPVKRFIYFSSAAVYGEEIDNLNIIESTPVYPMTFYGISKYSSECLFRKVISDHKQTSLLILRPTIVYGPKDRSNSYGPSEFINSSINGKKINLWGDGAELRDFIYIKDVVSITIKCIFSTFDGALNLASGVSYTYKEILTLTSDIVGADPKHSFRQRTKVKVNHRYNNKLLRDILSGHIISSIQEGMRHTFRELTSND